MTPLQHKLSYTFWSRERVRERVESNKTTQNFQYKNTFVQVNIDI